MKLDQIRLVCQQVRAALSSADGLSTDEHRMHENYLAGNAWRYAITLAQLRAMHGRTLRGASVLDVGSYPGQVAALLSQVEGAHVHAVSLMTNAVFEAHMAKLGVKVSVSDVERDPLPAADSSCEIVLCTELIEHLDGDVSHMLKESRRVLRPGGIFVLTTPNHASVSNRWNLVRGRSVYPSLDISDYPFYAGAGVRNPMRHVREFSVAEIERLLAAAGFSNVTTTTGSPPLQGARALSLKGVIATRALRVAENFVKYGGSQMIAIARR